MLKRIDLLRTGRERCDIFLFNREFAEFAEIFTLAESFFPGFGDTFGRFYVAKRFFRTVRVVPEIIARSDLFKFLYARIVGIDVKDTSANSGFVPRDRLYG